jgi:4-amino-4-deoxy-L-arabinose transferase-like glycosyltransferase
MENRRGRIGLISVVIVYSLALPAISTFFATSTIQLVTAEDYSKVLRVWSWAFLAQSVILPALLAFWILRGAAQERFGRG